MGRKTDEMARHDGYRVTLNEIEKSMLEQLAAENNVSMAEILRKGIRIQYCDLFKNEKSS